MALTTDELSQIKYHLGYGNLTVLARPYFDIARVFEDIVQNNVDAWGETYIRSTILPNLLTLEGETFSSRTNREVIKVDEVEFNPKASDELLSTREFWLSRLSVLTQVPRAVRSSGATVEQG